MKDGTWSKRRVQFIKGMKSLTNDGLLAKEMQVKFLSELRVEKLIPRRG